MACHFEGWQVVGLSILNVWLIGRIFIFNIKGRKTYQLKFRIFNVMCVCVCKGCVCKGLLLSELMPFDWIDFLGRLMRYKCMSSPDIIYSILFCMSLLTFCLIHATVRKWTWYCTSTRLYWSLALPICGSFREFFECCLPPKLCSSESRMPLL